MYGLIAEIGVMPDCEPLSSGIRPGCHVYRVNRFYTVTTASASSDPHSETVMIV
jgi:hypothetical protein